MRQALDYAWARPDPAAIKAAGYVGVIRYVTRDQTGKGVTRAELVQLQRFGIPVALVFEDAADRAALGYDAGRADALFANGYANALGWPINRPIYTAVDFDPTGRLTTCSAYLAGWRVASLRPMGVYGPFQVLSLPSVQQPGIYRWQTPAWSHGRRAKGLHLFQHNTIAVGGLAETDPNDILADDWGQHPAPAITPPSKEDTDVSIRTVINVGGRDLYEEQDFTGPSGKPAVVHIATVQEVADALSGQHRVINFPDYPSMQTTFEQVGGEQTT